MFKALLGDAEGDEREQLSDLFKFLFRLYNLSEEEVENAVCVVIKRDGVELPGSQELLTGKALFTKLEDLYPHNMGGIKFDECIHWLCIASKK